MLFLREKTQRAGRTVATFFCLISALFSAPVHAAIPNDPGYARQEYLEAIGMPSAWEFTKGSPSVTVAVLDTGVDLDHPDLKDRLWTNPHEIPGDGIDNDRNGYIDDARGWDFVDNDNDPGPDIEASGSEEQAQHGTLVAGIIGAAGHNGEGVAGVAWNVRLLPLRVLDSSGSGGSAAVEAAVRYAVAAGARIINISFSGPTSSARLASALRDAHRAGVVVVAAAGNEGDTARGGNLNIHPGYPACYRGTSGERIVIGVASLDRSDRRSSFSSYGSDCVELAAPGEHIYATQLQVIGNPLFGEAYGNGWAGSSLAAPQVAGVAALMLSLDASLTASDIRELLIATAANVDAQNPGNAGQLGAGRLQAAAALEAVQRRLLGQPSAPPAPSSPPASPTVPPPASSAEEWLTLASGGPRPSVAVLRGPGRLHASFQVTVKASSEAPSAAMLGRGQGQPLVAVGAVPGEAPYIRLFTAEGALAGQFAAYDERFQGGIRVAAVDVDGDGVEEIAAAPGPGGGPHVKVFKQDGRMISEFFAFDAKDRNGVRIAAIDLDGDGKDEIAAASSGRVAMVRIFSSDGASRLIFVPADFPPAGGYALSAGDLDGDGIEELAVADGRGGGRVMILARDGRRLREFFPYGRASRSGASISVAGAGTLLTASPAAPGEVRSYGTDGILAARHRPLGAASRTAFRLGS